MIARTTGRACLLAVQRFVRFVGPSLGRDPDEDLAALDACLPAHRTTDWHTTGTLVAGTPGRRRCRGPTLDAADLHRLVEVASADVGPHALRDRTRVALHCFSDLRPEEVVRLRWEDLSTELTVNDRYGLVAAVDRGGRRIELLLPGPAVAELEALATSLGAPIRALFGPVLCARGGDGRILSYRAARDVLRGASCRAGLPVVDAASLRAASAHWLRSQGISDHEVAAVLGLARVRSVDRLLRHHAALDAQRAVRVRLA
jgi:integrase